MRAFLVWLVACAMQVVSPPARAEAIALLRQIVVLANEKMKPPPNAEQREFDAAMRIAEEAATQPNPELLNALDLLSPVYPGTLSSADDSTRRNSVRIQTLRLKVMRVLQIRGQKIEETCGALAFIHGALNNRAGALEHTQCYADSVRERLGGSNFETVRAQLYVASELRAIGKVNEAIAEYTRLLPLTEGLELGIWRQAIVNAWAGYSQSLGLLAQYAQQEAALRRAIEIAAVTRDSSPESYISQLGLLAGFYDRWNRSDEADALVWQAYTLSNSKAPNAFNTGIQAWNAAGVSIRAGRWSEARELLTQALTLHKAYMPESYMHLGSIELTRSEVESGEGNLPAATASVRRALAHFQKYGYEVSEQGVSAHRKLADIYWRAGDLPAAAASLDAALAIIRKLSDEGSSDLIWALRDRSRLELAAGRRDAALATMKEAAAIVRLRLSGADAVRIDASGVREQFREFVGEYLDLLIAANDARGSFEAFQLVRQDSTSATVAKTFARASAGNSPLALELRKYEDKLGQWRRTDQELLTGVAAGNPAERARLESTRMALDAELAASRRSLAVQFPAYFEFVSSAPTPVETVQKALGPKEALLAFHFDRSGSFAWLVTPDAVAVKKLRLPVAQLRVLVKRIRASLQLDPGKAPGPFDLEAARALDSGLMEPFAPALKDLSHLTLISHDALQSVPASLLAFPSAAAEPKRDWLIRHFPISELPSISAFQAVRRLPALTTWERPFAGIGAPLLQGPKYAGQPLLTDKQVRGSLVKVEDIRVMPTLPDAESELRAMATTFDAAQQDLLIGPRASEPIVRTFPLSKYRVIAFATHGLLAGEKLGLMEPALVMTPPSAATQDNDGLLSASEIASMTLSADWVILSACNTAGSDGTPSASNLSGLARSFFAAGARSLLVSHWYVSSSATSALTTSMLNHYAKAKTGKSEALRQAMLAMIGREPVETHPAYWAPFSLVGDGSR